MSLEEQQLRVYGADLRRAHELASEALASLEIGAASRASSLLRAAAIELNDARQTNDKGRDELDIVREVCEIFDPEIIVDPLGSEAVRNIRCIEEVRFRLSCSQERAIKLIKEFKKQRDEHALPAGEQQRELEN